ncbi:very short patch repair endonuclease [Bradyrhizobium yuanmingense]|uniref:very short patch repair endonuclease n=1 Tax=Bradyrhizobium yuanmingense TaxID=108015 RepID=UPI000943C98E|nr:very short patch repair endonuclease [Bradyrhizobium yuanmingense]
MPDIVSKAKRSSMMAAVRQRHTKPELNLRQALHRIGLRYRLHRRDLPGTPDIVFVRSRVAVFVNGCFWHRHPGCSKATTPKLRARFWREKFEGNVARDRRAQSQLRKMGWKVVVVWECQVKNNESASKVAKGLLYARRAQNRQAARGR